MICDLQEDCKITFPEEISENIPTSWDINFLQTFHDNLKCIEQNDNSCDIIGLLHIVVIHEIKKYEI